MKLHLHIGAGKTGTSAIQRYLAMNEHQLSTVDVTYPLTEGERRKSLEGTSSGNGYVLCKLLLCKGAIRKKIPPNCEGLALSDWVDQTFSSSNSKQVLISTEVLQFPDPDQLKELSRILRDRKISVSVIYYARRALDYAVSAYLQNLQNGFPRHRNSPQPISRDKFLANISVPYKYTLEKYLASFGKASISVYSYDAYKSSLVRSFLDIFKLPYINSESSATPVVNRSLSSTEAYVFEFLYHSGVPGGLLRKLAKRIVNGMIPGLPDAEFIPFCLSASSAQLFLSRNSSIVDWLNSTFKINGKSIDLVEGTSHVLSDTNYLIDERRLAELSNSLLSMAKLKIA